MKVVITAEWDPEGEEREPDIPMEALMGVGLYDIDVEVMS